MERKCSTCQNAILVTKDNLTNIIFFEKGYYHEDCFRATCEKRAASKRGKPEKWKNALQNIETIKIETQTVLYSSFIKDDLNTYLLDNYDIVEVPKTLWQHVADIANGKYKHKRIRPVDTETLLEAWKWGQPKLNQIATQNRKLNNGPQDDAGRIMYDLAILLGKIPIYLKSKAKQEVNSANIKKELEASKEKVNYIAMTNRTNQQSDNKTDITSLVDDIF